jgi:MinD superfamily P-loop ATPase
MKPTHKWLPVIDDDKCVGCGVCVSVCRPGCLAKLGAVAELIGPGTCRSSETCVRVCAYDAIRMAWVPSSGAVLLGKWRTGAARPTPAPFLAAGPLRRSRLLPGRDASH